MDRPKTDMEALVRKRIEAEGPVRFRDFMAMALYEPGLGYYMRETAEIGAAGDFYTSPHAHPLFGAMMGRQAEECWEMMGRPVKFQVVEAGAGKGYLGLDMLTYLKGRPIWDALEYHIVEMNPSFEQSQREKLAEFDGKAIWHSELRQAGPVRGLILSNELVDALPVHLVVMQEELKEIYVAVRGGVLVEEPGPVSQGVAEYLGEFGVELREGWRTEAHLDAREWLEETAAALEEGFLLTIDYGWQAEGYYNEDRSQGTLLCYHEHKVTEDFLANIGLQDLTAHVNFSGLRRWGDALGLQALGFTRQGPYLVSLGLDEVMTGFYKGKSPGRDLAGIQNLIMAGTMGDTHKVLLQCRGEYGNAKPRGFLMRNQVESL